MAESPTSPKDASSRSRSRSPSPTSQPKSVNLPLPVSSVLLLFLLSIPVSIFLRTAYRVVVPNVLYLEPTTRPRPFHQRIVAIGDLHGDLEHALRVLRLAELVDHRGAWIGKASILVQTGDIVDRAKDTIALYTLMNNLRKEAAQQGGRVISLLGNHEYMNGLGDWRYVTPEDIASFGGERNRRHAMSADGWIGQSWLNDYSVTARVPYTAGFPGLAPREADAEPLIKDQFPPQILLRPPSLTPLSPGELPPSSTYSAEDDDDPISFAAASFVHGGIHPSWASLGTEGINAVGESLLRKILDPALTAPLSLPRNVTQQEKDFYGAEGPLWWRGFALEKDEDALCKWVEETRTKLGVRRLVMGHTPFFDGIKSRCRGRAIIIDTGISRAYGGALACLEIQYDLAPRVPRPPPGAKMEMPDEMKWTEKEAVAALYEGRPKEYLVKLERSFMLPTW